MSLVVCGLAVGALFACLSTVICFLFLRLFPPRFLSLLLTFYCSFSLPTVLFLEAGASTEFLCEEERKVNAFVVHR